MWFPAFSDSISLSLMFSAPLTASSSSIAVHKPIITFVNVYKVN